MSGPNLAIPVSESKIGVAIETARGTATAPVFWLPVKAPKYKPDMKMIPDETLQGSMVQIYDEVPGLRYDSHGWDSFPYLDSFPVLLRAILGSSDNLTAAPTSTTLAASVAAGSSSVSATASIASGSFITIGSGITQEAHLTASVTGAGPYTVTLASPMLNNQASGASVTGLTKHQFSLLNNSASTSNQPPTVTITDYAGDVWRQLAGSQLDTLTLKGTADALDDYTCSWFSNSSASPASTPSDSWSGVEAPPGWTTQIAVGGTYLQTLVSWEYSLKRNVKPVPAITGTQNYFALQAFALTPTLKVTFLAQASEPQLAAYEAGTVESFDLTLSDVQSGYALNLHTTKAKYLTADIDRSKEWVEVPLEVQLLPSASDALAGGVSPLLATVGNAQTSAY